MFFKVFIFFILSTLVLPVFYANDLNLQLEMVGTYLSGVGTFGLLFAALLFAPDEISKVIHSTRFNRKAHAIAEIFEHTLKYEDGLKRFINPLNDTEGRTNEEIFEIRLEKLQDTKFQLEVDLRLAKVLFGAEVSSYIEEVLKLHRELTVKSVMYTVSENQLGRDYKIKLYNELMDIESIRTNRIHEINAKIKKINNKYWGNK